MTSSIASRPALRRAVVPARELRTPNQHVARAAGALMIVGAASNVRLLRGGAITAGWT